MIKVVLRFIVVLCFTLWLAGCYDYSEPDEKAWVLAMGMDRGRENILTVTAVIAIPKNIAGGGGGQSAGSGGDGEEDFITVSMEAPTLLSSLELLNAVVDRRADLSHTKWFVFSRDLAEEGIERYFSPIARFHQFRRSSYMVVCEGSAEDFLSRGVSKLEDNVGKYYELMQRGWLYTEFIPRDTFHEFYLESHARGVSPVAALASLQRERPVYPDNSPKPKGDYRAGKIPIKGGVNIEIMGGAVFKLGKMVGTLSASEMGARKMLNGTLKRTIMDVPDPGHPGSYIIVEAYPRQGPDVEVSIVDGFPKIKADIKLEGEIISIQSRKGYEKPQNIREVERAVEQEIMKDINATIEKSLDLGTDFFGFGLKAKKLFRTWPEWEAYNWDEKYPAADIQVTVDYRVRRTGLIHESVPVL